MLPRHLSPFSYLTMCKSGNELEIRSGVHAIQSNETWDYLTVWLMRPSTPPYFIVQNSKYCLLCLDEQHWNQTIWNVKNLFKIKFYTCRIKSWGNIILT